MAATAEQVRDSMRQKLNQLGEKVNEAKAGIEQADLKREADFHRKVEAAREKVQEKQGEATQKRQKIEQDIQAKRAEWHEKVEDWKAERNRDRLEARAEDTEYYAAEAFDVAVAAVYEADLAILEAIEARQEAEAATSI